MPNEKESDIQRAIKEYLQYRGWMVYKNHQSLGSHRGLFDLTAVKDGRVVWIEVKKPKGKLSEHQVKFMAEITVHGGECMEARSIDDVKNL